MSAARPEALRTRFQRLIEEGLTGRAAALRLKLSPATRGQMGAFDPTDGSGLPRPARSARGQGKLAPYRAFFAEIIAQDGDVTMPGLASALHAASGVPAHPTASGKNDGGGSGGDPGDQIPDEGRWPPSVAGPG